MINALIAVIQGVVRLAPVVIDGARGIAQALRSPAKQTRRAPGELSHADAERQARAARNAGHERDVAGPGGIPSQGGPASGPVE